MQSNLLFARRVQPEKREIIETRASLLGTDIANAERPVVVQREKVKSLKQTRVCTVTEKVFPPLREILTSQMQYPYWSKYSPSLGVISITP